jgi:flagellar basal body rod protein FlgC
MDVFAISTSGMQAAVASLDVAASNVANSQDNLAPGGGGQGTPVTAAQPHASQQLVQFPLADGGVGFQTVPAGGDDLGLDMVTQMMAVEQFKANVAVFQTGEEAMKSLLSLKA